MAAISYLDTSAPRLTLAQKIWSINWGLVTLLGVIACFGFAMLYSAANGDLQPWAAKQMIRFAISLALMLFVAVIDIRTWLRLAYIIYGVAFILLVAVEIRGAIGMGAQRWIDLGVIQL